MEAMTVTYLIVPERSHDGSWWAVAPDLPGLLLAGDTRDDLLSRASAAMADYFDAMNEAGFPILAPGTHPVERTGDQEEPVPITVTVPAA
jgi:predicted RNase H-like HicB family nuclease